MSECRLLQVPPTAARVPTSERPSLTIRFNVIWTLEPVPGGTQIQLAFDGAAKLVVLGRVAERMLGRRRRLEVILDNYERELTGATQTG